MRTAVALPDEVDNDDDGYYDDGGWDGPGFYFGIWFDNDADYYYWRRGGHYYHGGHYYRHGGGHGHGHGGGGHGGGGHHGGGGGHGGGGHH